MICSLSLPLPKIDFSVAAVSSAFFPHCLSADRLSSTMIHANLFSLATSIVFKLASILRLSDCSVLPRAV